MKPFRNRKETPALIWTHQHFKVYLGTGSGPVAVSTDHNPLAFFISMQCPDHHFMHWTLFLQDHSVHIRHIRSKNNVIADALSRASWGEVMLVNDAIYMCSIILPSPLLFLFFKKRKKKEKQTKKPFDFV